MDAVIKTPKGLLVGDLLEDEQGSVCSFKGVPYALPPIGIRRWRPAEEMHSWYREREAKNYSPACPQVQMHKKSDTYYYPLPQMSEDCLYLNVWAPGDILNQPKKQYPVLVFIHGGGLVFGAATGFDGTDLARRDIVVVTINYRLNVFGYFAHPELSSESPYGVSGNYGVTDQIAALKWVQDNIESFGGDSNNVTVSGHSGGGFSVPLLMATQLTSGLFHKAIVQSGYLPSMSHLKKPSFGKPSAEDQGINYVRDIGNYSLEELRSLPADILLRPLEGKNFLGLYRDVVIDDWIFTDQLIDTFEKGGQHDVPFMVGYTSSESSYMEQEFDLVFPNENEQYLCEVRSRFPALSNEYLALYPPDNIRDAAMASLADGFFGWGCEKYARCASKGKSNVYFYFIDHVMSWAEELGLGAFHGVELLSLFFGIADHSPGEKFRWALGNWPDIEITEEDIVQANLCLDIWATFIKKGDPNSNGNRDWRPFNERSLHYMCLRQGKAICGVNLKPGMFELNEKIIRSRRENDMSWMQDVGILSPKV